jgi:hypothetical protein
LYWPEDKIHFLNIKGTGFGVQVTELAPLCGVAGIINTSFFILRSCYRVPVTSCREIQVSGFRFQVSGFRFQVSGFRFQVSGFTIQDSPLNAGFELSVVFACSLQLIAVFVFALGFQLYAFGCISLAYLHISKLSH